MSIQTRARSDDSKSPDPEKVLHRASYGLFSRRSRGKISDSPQAARALPSERLC